MKTKCNYNILEQIQSLNFKVVGPFLVADLSSKSDKFFNSLKVGEYGMENVLRGQKAKSHIHDFPSFYKTSCLDVECGSKRFSLPSITLTLVLPFITHSWIPKKGNGFVGSVDLRHKKPDLIFYDGDILKSNGKLDLVYR